MCRTWWLSTSLAALALIAPRLAHAVPIETVALGTDYFETAPGTFDNIPGLGRVDFKGVPFGPGTTDTTVQRQADAVINGPAIPIQITGLQLMSTNLATPVFVSLDPLLLGQDTGTMLISGTTAGGTFTSTLKVNFVVCTTPGVKGVGCDGGMQLMTGALTLVNPVNPLDPGASWMPDPPPGAVLVTGPFGDQAANIHTGRPGNEVDFFPGHVVECDGPNGCHPVDPAKVPEPAALAILGAGLIGLGAARLHRR